MVPIEIRDVTLTYDTPGGKVPGVQNVSIDIGASEFICIIGPSGCGKSTLLNIIAGFLAPASGEIRIGGKAVTGHGMDRGVVFQDFAQLFPWRTALGAMPRDEMQRLLAHVWKTTRKSVIYVTHNVAEAVYLADRVIVMSPHPGTVKAEIKIELPRPRDPLSVEFLECQKELLRHLGHDAGAEEMINERVEGDIKVNA